jgi:hypothetical protein
MSADDDAEMMKAIAEQYKRAAQLLGRNRPPFLEITHAGSLYAPFLDVMYGPATCGSQICTRLDHRTRLD